MMKLTALEIKNLGFDWPRYSLIREYAVITEDGKIVLTNTLEALQGHQAYYQQQVNQAYAFKQQTGADYADFTNRFDEFAGKLHQYQQASNFISQIIQAAEQQDDD